jgi:uncharacterized protein (DUF305 family)
MKPYLRFVLMISISTVLMWALMYANVYSVAWMKAMIPHHSIAILTSERARLTDPRVRELAQEIVESQRREIAQMRALVAEIEGESRTR